jgi:hypothetical protein
MGSDPNQGVSQQQILQFMTTEHVTLQTAKQAIVAESNGRAALYLSSVSSGVVALAFIGQMSQLGDAFFLFGLAIFLPLFFLGIATFVRLEETATESMMHARRINRIRHYYVQVAPEMAPYFVRRTHDDMVDFLDELAMFDAGKRSRLWGWWHMFLTISGAVAAINAVVGAMFFGFLAHVALDLSRSPSIAVAMAAFLATLVLHVRHLHVKHVQSERHFETMFPQPQSAG